MVRKKKVASKTEGDREKIEKAATSDIAYATDVVATSDDVVMVVNSQINTDVNTDDNPLFINDVDLYRQLLLERPVLPVFTDMQTAVKFAGEYEKWNSRVQQTFK